MKKFLIISVSILLLVLGALVVVPLFFKDEVKSAIDEQLAKTIDAEVIFDIDNFSLSIFPNFPNMTAGINKLGVIGRNDFAGEVLFAAEEFAVEINLGKLIFNDEMSIKSIFLDQPQIFIKVLPSGQANYDIVIESEDEPPLQQVDENTPENFNISIDHWEIRQGKVVYEDATIPMVVRLSGLDHSGSGDFSLSLFDLTTNTTAMIEAVSYDNITYLADKKATIDMTLNMDLDAMRFTFAENIVRVNDFGFGFDGWLAMPEDDINMQLSFNASNNSFKSFISLIPAIYANDFDELETSGRFSFSGTATGTYNDSEVPAFNIDLAVEDGMFHYPDLPESVSNVQLKMSVANPDGIIENTRIDVSNLHIDFGPNPVDASLQIENLRDYPVKGRLEAEIDLKNITEIFPVEGLAMAGVLKANLNANGVYDSTRAIMPKIKGRFELSDGQLIYAELPAPLADIYLEAEIENGTGLMKDFRFAIKRFAASLEGSPIMVKLAVEDLDDYQWQADFRGDLNFDKLLPIIDKMYPLPGTDLTGNIKANLVSSGRMSDLEAGRYDKLATSGSVVFDNFYYVDTALLPQGLKVNSGRLRFGPAQAVVNAVKMEVGQSDFEFSGTLENYLNYALKDNALLTGSLSVDSKFIDLNEWLDTENLADQQDEIESSDAKGSDSGVIEVPANIDFTLMADLDKILYQNTTLANAKGTIIIKDGILNLNNLRTNMLGGEVIFTGNYNTRNLDKPSFNMDLKVTEISIQESYKALTTVKVLAPVARHIAGNLTTSFNLRGVLKDDMMPDLATLTGGGLLKVAQAILNNPKLVQGLTQFTADRAGADSKLTFKDILMTATIKDGKMAVEPFDVQIMGYETNINGYTGLDGSLDYNIQMDIPAGEIGGQVNSLLSSFTGDNNPDDKIKVKFNLGGTYDNPKIKLLGAGGSDVREQVKQEAIEQVLKIAGGDDTLVDTLQNLDLSQEALAAEATRQKQLADSLIQVQKDSLEKVAAAEIEAARKKALEEASKKLNSLFKKKND
jgi:hypothetical protein